MQQPQYGKKTYIALGKMLLSKHPDVAEQLLTYCRVSGDTNLDNIPIYFHRFCDINQLTPSDYTGRLVSQDKLRMRRLFVGAMLHIYNEHIFHQPHTSPLMRNGFVKKLSECQNIKKAWMSRLIRQVIFDEKVYEAFRIDIQNIVSQLKILVVHGEA
jgi:hypothetical protein